MGWTKRETERHKHDAPKTYNKEPGKTVEIGDEWTCACGQVLRVVNRHLTYDQRDGDYYTLSWEPVVRRNESHGKQVNSDYIGPYGSGVPFGQ